jgi:hypothetical protein
MAAKSKAGALPFLGVSEGLDLVKKVWGVTGLPMLPTPASVAQFATRLPQTLPSMIAPTLDVDELDKRIADLRAVEQWLNLNLSMLRTTVQSLEVQRNTIATLKSFGGAMLSAGAGQPAAAAPMSQWPYPPAPPVGSAGTQPPAPAPAPAPARRRRGKSAADGAPALPLNPVAWWNTLQDQFAKIAATAAAEAQAAAKEAARKAEAEKPKPPRPAARPAAKAPGTTTASPSATGKARPAKAATRERRPPRPGE